MKQLKIILLSVFMISVYHINAQKLTQSIRGRIVDVDSEIPAIGATVVVVGSDPFIGAATDVDGYFKLKNVPIGRITIEISSVGYEKKVMSNIIVNSGKEVFLSIEITESLNKLEEFIVTGNTKKDEPINEMALISSKQFSTEETKKYAGTLGDPARMAGNFAGARNNSAGNNDIIVRGNSPTGILWQIEGIEIPNPNHFSAEGSTGGPINALNSNVLANSEFLTGAFAPEYGNVISGVFDMKLRQGNNEKREYTFGLGLFGTDFTIEGPFKKGGKSSYLANYRYSSLGLLDDLGLVNFNGTPKYQDASFNFYLPTKKLGIFKLFGFGGLSHIINEDPFSEDNDSIIAKVDQQSHVGFVALNHSYIFNKHTYLKSNVSLSSNGTKFITENRINDNDYLEDESATLNNKKLRIATALHKKVNAKNKISTGINYTNMFYDFYYKNRIQNNEFEKILDADEGESYVQLHGTWKHRFNEKLTMVSGVHYLQFNLNKSNSIEPRVGFSYKLKENQTFTAGFGVHSKILPLPNYSVNETDESGGITQPNRSLELPKANHYVLGYDYQFTGNTHVKTEIYYQDLYDTPEGNDSDAVLISQGKGRNYGLEITLERYFSKGFYYLLTTSIYESQYKNKGVWKATALNGKYNANLLIGKEFKVGKTHKNKSLMFSIKGGLQGGDRFRPIDIDKSIDEGEETYTSDERTVKGEDILFLNFAAVYKINRKKTTHELKFEVLNATGNQTKVGEYYDTNREVVKNEKQWPSLPNLTYTINF